MSTFMCQKSFHPASQANQKARWIAEQREEKRKEMLIQRQKQLEQEKNEAGDDKRSAVSFMYKPPPGYMASISKQAKNEEQAHPALEDELPHLKNAPTEGSYTKDIVVTHKAFGIETRFVRCLRCGKKGHQSGERECALAGMDPNDDVNKAVEDPLKLMNMNMGEEYNHGNLLMKDQLSSIHHGPEHLKGKYDIIGSDDEGEMDAGELVESLNKKQRKRLLKYMKKHKKEEKKRLKKQKRAKRLAEESAETWVEADSAERSPERYSGTKRSREDNRYRDRDDREKSDYQAKRSRSDREEVHKTSRRGEYTSDNADERKRDRRRSYNDHSYSHREDRYSSRR
mmetsp:Transcript_123869/g.185143  ORF Transcript_123869/g.185143 Transcript_123869/m.185143 type:complete len:341 (-) Transcript_123869:72-1094(-)